MRGFTSSTQAQRFLSVHAHIGSLFRMRHCHILLPTIAWLGVRHLELWRRHPAPLVLPKNTYPLLDTDYRLPIRTLG